MDTHHVQYTTSPPTSRTPLFLSTKLSAISLSAFSSSWVLPRLLFPLRRALVSHTLPNSAWSPLLTQPTDTSKTQKALTEAENALSRTKKDREDKERDLARLFDPEWFGAQGEWKKLDRTCLEKEVGECVSSHNDPSYRTLTALPCSYIYEVCLFDEARQKPLKTGSTFSLGCVNNVASSLTLPCSHICAVASSPGTTPRASKKARPNITGSSTTPAAQSAGTGRRAVSRCVSISSRSYLRDWHSHVRHLA